MDLGSKLIEIEGRYYIQLVKELKDLGMPASIGVVLAKSILGRFLEDAMFVGASSNESLEEELSSKMKEIEELKSKVVSI